MPGACSGSGVLRGRGAAEHCWESISQYCAARFAFERQALVELATLGCRRSKYSAAPNAASEHQGDGVPR